MYGISDEKMRKYIEYYGCKGHEWKEMNVYHSGKIALDRLVLVREQVCIHCHLLKSFKNDLDKKFEFILNNRNNQSAITFHGLDEI